MRLCTKGALGEEEFSRKGATTQRAAAFRRIFFAPLREILTSSAVNDKSVFLRRDCSTISIDAAQRDLILSAKEHTGRKS